MPTYAIICAGDPFGVRLKVLLGPLQYSTLACVYMFFFKGGKVWLVFSGCVYACVCVFVCICVIVCGTFVVLCLLEVFGATFLVPRSGISSACTLEGSLAPCCFRILTQFDDV